MKCVGALLLVAAFGSTGCDSIKARMAASEAAKLFHDGRIEEAIAKYEWAASTDPNIDTIQLNLGFANLALYQQSPKSKVGENAANRAVTAFESFLKLKPNDERGTQYLVQTFVDTSRYEAAVQYYQPQIQKNDPQAFNTLGIIASKTGKFDDAKDWYTKRVAADPKNPEARLALGVLIWDYVHNHKELAPEQKRALADEGIKVLGEAIELAPKAPNAYTYTNLLYRERADLATTDDEKRPELEKANEFFKKAMALQKAAK